MKYLLVGCQEIWDFGLMQGFLRLMHKQYTQGKWTMVCFI